VTEPGAGAGPEPPSRDPREHPAHRERREATFREAQRADLRRNYTAHLAHGLLGQTGFRLVNAPTFIPAYVFEVSGSNLVVGLARGLQALGMSLTPIFAASVIEHRRRVLPTGFLVGTLMRVQVLGIALAGFFLPREWNAVAVCLLLGAFGFFLGMQGVIFNLLVSKVIPVERRGLLVGLRNALSGMTAAAVGIVGGQLVDSDALGNGYATTFGLAFLLTMAGLCALLLVREPASPAVRRKAGMGERLRDLPALLRADRAFTFYFLARALGALGRMAAPFYYVYAASRLELSGAELGYATAAFVLGLSVLQLVWGLVADRTGFRATFLGALALWILSVLGLMRAADLPQLLVVFAGLGGGMGGFLMSAQNLVLEFGSRENLPMRIAVANTATEAVGIAGPIAAGLLADAASYLPVFWIAIACKAAAFAIVLARVDEPRRRRRARPHTEGETP